LLQLKNRKPAEVDSAGALKGGIDVSLASKVNGNRMRSYPRSEIPICLERQDGRTL